jgi:3-phosphoshikimate 1-carboxyvinyltransferase
MNAQEVRAVRRAARGDVEIQLPPSKSYTQRALIAAALASGESVILNPSRSLDSLVMVASLRKFGIAIGDEGNVLSVRGCGGAVPGGDRTIDVGNAGTCMRFLSALAALVPGTTVLTGDRAMLRRPVLGLVRALRDAGVDASCEGDFPPVTIRGGGIGGGRLGVDASQSSQFLSALLLVAPYAARPMEIAVTGVLSSAPYAAMTISVMEAFGVRCSQTGPLWRAEEGGRFAAREYTVEADVSAGSVFAAAAAITGSSVVLPGIRAETLQGDVAVFPLLREMGCGVDLRADRVVVTGGRLRGIRADMNSLPDSVPALAVTAAFASTPTTITGIGHLRLKESDRIGALERELGRIGAGVSAGAGEIRITPSPLAGCEVETYNDHRIAMCLAVAGLKLDGMLIRNPGCVSKSFPGFWTELEKFN